MAVRNTLLGVGSLVMLALTSAKLTLLVLLMVPLVIGPIVLFGRRVRRLSRASQDRVADLGAYVDETLHEIRTVQAYGHEAQDRRLFAERLEAAFDTALQRVRQRAALIAAVIVLVFGGIGVILWIGGHDVLAGRLTRRASCRLSSSTRRWWPARPARSARSIGDLQRGAGAAERLIEILQNAPQVTAPRSAGRAAGAATRHRRAGRASLSIYPTRPTQPALDDFTLRVQPGEKLALVGPSGAGKIDRVPAADALLRSEAGRGAHRRRRSHARRSRALCAAASPWSRRSPAIFAASVRDNVRYGRPDASRSSRSAPPAKPPSPPSSSSGCPEGYDTELGERGVRLSGGQRQRLAIARAILSDRPMLLLDEATSALDSESERMVQAALERLMRGRTTLIIAHRLATVRSVDRIAVIDRGRLVGLGRHEELLLRASLYSRLAALQFGL